MKKLLHVVATPRGEESRTLRVAQAFLKAFKPTHPDWAVEELNLFKEPLPALTSKSVAGKYVLLGGKDLQGEVRDAWQGIIAHINRFLSADGYLISTPMWNFSIPYVLKHYIDIIVQPKYLFTYSKEGIKGLVTGRKMVVIASRGGDYSVADMRPYDLQEPYLRTIFGFVGISDISFVLAEGMDLGPAEEKANLEAAQESARKLAETF